MSISFGIFTFVNVWWMMLFLVLPFGVRRESNPTALDYAAAPKPHRWKKLFIINSLLSLMVTLALALLIRSGIVPLTNLS